MSLHKFQAFTYSSLSSIWTTFIWIWTGIPFICCCFLWTLNSIVKIMRYNYRKKKSPCNFAAWSINLKTHHMCYFHYFIANIHHKTPTLRHMSNVYFHCVNSHNFKKKTDKQNEEKTTQKIVGESFQCKNKVQVVAVS